MEQKYALESSSGKRRSWAGVTVTAVGLLRTPRSMREAWIFSGRLEKEETGGQRERTGYGTKSFDYSVPRYLPTYLRT
jgi:hypothetical protein